MTEETLQVVTGFWREGWISPAQNIEEAGGEQSWV